MAEPLDPERLRAKAEPAALAFRANLNPYFFEIESACAEVSCALGGSSAARRLSSPKSRLREDYTIEIWAADPWETGKQILSRLNTPRTKSPQLHMWLHNQGPRISLGMYTLCTLRRAPKFRGESLLSLVPLVRAAGLFNPDAKIACMHPSALLFQTYEALSAAELPKGTTYQEHFEHEAVLFEIYKNTPMPKPTTGGYEHEPIDEPISGGKQKKTPVKTYINKLGLPIVAERPHLIVLSDDPKNADELEEKIKSSGVTTMRRRNFVLLPRDEQVSKVTIYETQGERRRPLCELYETPTNTPAQVQGEFAAPLTRLQHIFSEIWIATALLASGALTEKHARERIDEMTGLAVALRKRLKADPTSAITNVKWYGYLTNTASGLQKKKQFRETVYAIDLAK